MKKKKNKTKPSSSSSNQINGSDSSTFHVSIATTAVSQICHSVGYKATQTTALQTLTNITVRYLTSLATSAANSAVSTGRTECNLYDVIRALDDVHADVGFEGNSAVTKRLSSLRDSEMLKDLMRFVHWSREMPFAKPLPRGRQADVPKESYCGEKEVFTEGKSEGEKEKKVTRGKQMVTSPYGESNGNENLNHVGKKSYCGEKEVFTVVNEGKSGGEKEKEVPRGKQMVTSLCENEKLSSVGKKDCCGEKEVFTVVNGGEKEKKVTRGRKMVTSLYGGSSGNEKLNHLAQKSYCGKNEVFTVVNEGKSEGEMEKNEVPRGKQMVTSLCENEKLSGVGKKDCCGEKEVFTVVNECENEKKVTRGKQMVTSLYGESNGNEELNDVAKKSYCGEKEVFTEVNEGKSKGEKEKKVPRGKQMVEKSGVCHVPKWLPEFPRKSECGEKVVFTEVNEGKNENEKVKVSELPVVRKKVRFEIGGKSGRGKEVINLKFGVDLRSGVCKGGKRILCQIYEEEDGKKIGKGDYDVVKKRRRYIRD